MPNIIKEFKKKDDSMQFADKILAMNPVINLESFKDCNNSNNNI